MATALMRVRAVNGEEVPVRDWVGDERHRVRVPRQDSMHGYAAWRWIRDDDRPGEFVLNGGDLEHDVYYVGNLDVAFDFKLRFG